MPKPMPRSSVGTSSLGSLKKNQPLAATRISATRIISSRCRKMMLRVARKKRSRKEKKASKERAATLSLSPCSRLSTRAESIGERVRATKLEMATATARATPNSLNNRPTEPVRKARGTKTATSETEVAITAKPTSCTPSTAAWRRRLPISM